jgi:DNA-binding MurR/RpiR family transcriptional regulator
MKTSAKNLPRDFEALRARIIDAHPRLPRRLAQIAAFALERPDEIALGTAVSLAKKADVQPSTLIRFAQAMGYEGFTDLQSVFRERLRERVLNYEERLNLVNQHMRDLGREERLLKGFAEASMRSAASLHERMDTGQLERAAGILAAAETIYIVGLRRSFPIAAYLAYAFGKLGVKTVLAGTAGGLEPELIGFATPKDAVIAISFTPYAPATLDLATEAAARGVPLVAITDSPFSPMAQSAKCWFEVVEADFEGFRSLTASFTLAATLTVAVAQRRRAKR